jgi:type II secretory pathway component PulJ
MNFYFDKGKSNSGFTLIELLLYMGLFSILLTVFIQLFGTVFETQLESEATTSIATDAKFIMGRFTYDLNRAESIVFPTSLASASSTLTIIADSEELTYSLQDGNLMLDNSTDGTLDQLNSNEASVSAVSFVRFDGGDKDVIQMSFTLVSGAIRTTGREIKTYETSAGLR